MSVDELWGQERPRQRDSFGFNPNAELLDDFLGSTTSSDSILDDADEEELGRYLEQLEKCEKRLLSRDDSRGAGGGPQVPPKGDQ